MQLQLWYRVLFLLLQCRSFMIILNYAHPLTDAILDQITATVGAAPEVRMIDTQTDRLRPMADVAAELADAAQLSPVEWQTLSLLVNPPWLAPLTVALTAEIHGRMGHFPTILNIRPVLDSVPTRYELGELVNLDHIRKQARTRR